MFSKILIPLDGSKSSEKAVPYARHLAKLDNAEILLVMIPDELWSGGIPSAGMGPYMGMGAYPIPQDYIETRLRHDKEYLANLQVEVERDGISVTTHCPSGDPASEVLELAEREGCDLIVLTSHGRTGIKRFLIGSVAEKVARHSSCPVLIVGHHSFSSGEAEPEQN